MKPEDSDPLNHVANMRKRFSDLKDHLRADIERVDEPQFKALCETAAEVLGGLEAAFADYAEGEEAAWVHDRS